MPHPKISLITVVFNAEVTIDACIRSVIGQTYKNIEYIVIDGGSTDNTIQIIRQYSAHISVFLSEPDKGIYDAMNKGIKMATGDVIGTLNADDVFADAGVLSSISSAFTDNCAEIVYGDLDYINDKGAITREWRSGLYRHNKFNWGWMPPHPTFYCTKELFEKFGYYDLAYGTAADYELMLRFIHFHRIRPEYLEKVLVKMKVGGASNKNIHNRVKASLSDLKAMRNNGIILPFLIVVFKPFRKIFQFF